MSRRCAVGLLCLVVCGCSAVRDKVAESLPFFAVPRDKVIEVATRPVDPFRDFPRLDGDRKPDIGTLERAVDAQLVSYGDHTRPPEPFRCVSEFLCVSDVQLRDEEIYSAGYVNELVYFDRYVGVSIRRPFMEKYDTLNFASLLIGYRKELAKTKRSHGVTPFIIHPGDLCDISSSTELLTALLAVKQCLRGNDAPRFYSAGGNHDGLVFGNMPNHWADMQMLGANLSEFVLGHVLLDPPEAGGTGFGFAGNEILQRFGRGQKGLEYPTIRRWAETTGAPVRHGVRGLARRRGEVVALLGPETLARPMVHELGWRGQAARQGRYLLRAANARYQRATRDGANAAQSLAVPLLFGEAIEMADQVDGGETALGYYHWDEPLPQPVGEMAGIRTIVLDTRTDGHHQGTVGLIQLGWLYNQLADALARRYGVVLFAHHSPSMILGSRRLPFTGPTQRAIFERMLRRFPHILAYFYGHAHWNEHERFGRIPVIQTGSLTDFPRVARKLWIYAAADDGLTARIAWEFVRPRGAATSEGRLLDAILATSLKDSLREHNQNTSTLLAWLDRVQHGLGILRKRPESFERIESDAEEWCNEHLRQGHVEVRFGFDGSSKKLRASRIFGARLRSANGMRDYMGCEPVAAEPARIDPPKGPPFAEPSAIVFLGKPGKRVAVVADDETPHALFRAAWGSGDPEWAVVPLKDTTLADLEALAAWSERQLIAVCSQSRTLGKGVTEAARSRLALITFDAGIERIERVQVYDGLRPALIAHLGRCFPHGPPPQAAGDWLTKVQEVIKGRPSAPTGPPRLAVGLDAVAEAKPTGGGLNVEGAVKWDGLLLLGLRDPSTAAGQPIVVPLLNPDALFAGRPPQFGPPLLLDAGTSGPGHAIARWTPPSASTLRQSDPTKPLILAIPRDRVAPLSNARFGFRPGAVPDGLAIVEGSTPAADRLVVVQDPEDYARRDIFIGVAALRDCFMPGND